MRGHKIITVERGDGFAARCEVERDGEIHLCDITFGGFPTRTAARQAITHEEALGAVAPASEGTILEGTNNLMTIVDPAPEPFASVKTIADAAHREGVPPTVVLQRELRRRSGIVAHLADLDG